MTTPHSDVSFAWLMNCRCARRYSTMTNGCNFATAIHTVAYDSVPQCYVGNVDIRVGSISTTEGVTCLIHDVVAHVVLVNLFYIKVFFTRQVVVGIHRNILDIAVFGFNPVVVLLRCCDVVLVLISISYKSIVDIQVGSSTNHTPFTGSVCITCDGRYPVVKVVLVLVEGGVQSICLCISSSDVGFGTTNDDIGFTKHITSDGCGR